MLTSPSHSGGVMENSHMSRRPREAGESQWLTGLVMLAWRMVTRSGEALSWVL